MLSFWAHGPLVLIILAISTIYKIVGLLTDAHRGWDPHQYWHSIAVIENVVHDESMFPGILKSPDIAQDSNSLTCEDGSLAM